MKVRVSEATGPVLDWMASAAHGDSDIHPYSSNWEDGGPIIEKIGIGTAKKGGVWIASLFDDPQDTDDWDYLVSAEGPTPLIAAMRCYVVSKLGNAVEVPDELLT